jgi:hypothetical protein
LPFTQTEIEDALGLSTVHVNRTLGELRGAGRIILRSGALSVKDWKGLKETGEFDPTFLHQERRAACLSLRFRCVQGGRLRRKPNEAAA